MGMGKSGLVHFSPSPLSFFNRMVYWGMFVALIVLGGLKVILKQMKIEKGPG